MQPDFGNTVLICVTIFAMIILSGAKLSHIFSIFLVLLSSFLSLIYIAPYRMKRVLSFLDPYEDPQGTGYQIIQSFVSFAKGKFFGVGKVTAKKMNDLGIYYGADLRKLEKDKLIAYFGKTGSHYYKIVRSIQDSPVNPSRIRKSVGAERTFSKDIKSEAFMLDELDSIADEHCVVLNGW